MVAGTWKVKEGQGPLPQITGDAALVRPAARASSPHFTPHRAAQRDTARKNEPVAES
jgi:hypothetical protein